MSGKKPEKLKLDHYVLDGELVRQVVGERRRDRNFSMQRLADAAGVSVATVHKIESGQFSVQFDMLVRVLDALELPPETVIGYKGKTGTVPLDEESEKLLAHWKAGRMDLVLEFVGKKLRDE